MDSNELAQRYKFAVEENLGLIAKIDGDNDVVFKHPDLGTFYFSLDAEKDPEYFRLVYSHFADKILTGGDKTKLLQLLNQVNRECKAVKLIMLDDDDGNVVAATEGILAGPDQGPSQELLSSVVRRYLSVIRTARENLFNAAKVNQG